MKGYVPKFDSRRFTQLTLSPPSSPTKMQGVAPRTVGNLAPGPLPPPIIPRNLKKVKFMDIEPLELARQLTIMDGRLFQRITPQECLGKAWPKEFGNEAANISAMIDMSNAVSYFQCLIFTGDFC